VNGRSPVIDIRVERVSKRYLLRSTSRFENKQSFLTARRRQAFWALRDVSFAVQRGEALGIVGPNGSGKTTLVKLLSRITSPSEGTITISGRLSALIELGAGFHPDLTGRENIFLNGSILGMTHREIAGKVPSIIEFSEINPFIDSPVKKYSSGMFLRLAFSIAVHLETDIVLLDEVLAVGDVSFQARCFEQVERLRKVGKTVVLVSHDFAAIERICDRALLLHSGEVVMMGKPHAVIEHYQALAYSALADSRHSGVPPNRVTCTKLTFAGPTGASGRTGDPLRCRLSYLAREALDDVVVTVSLNWPSGYLCTQLSSQAGLRLEPGPGEIEFLCPMLTMQRGLYSVDVLIERRGEVLDWRPRCSLLRVDLGKVVAGDFYLEHSCLIRQQAADG
jgi:ABC-type polysaccharide/polyol phosphate transport system ATPase subunit